jgi:hypothetical protein
MFLTTTFFIVQVWAETEVSYGKAYDEKNQLLYTEKHVTQFKESRMVSLKTTYYDLNKKQFAKLSSDFTERPYLPDYIFSDSRFGREDGVRKSTVENKITVFARKTTNSETKTSDFKVKPLLITGQGLHSYMNQNLDMLVKKKDSTPIEFLIPTNQKSYKFEIVKLLVDKNKAVFKVKIKSWVLSLFAPYLKVTYELSTKRLLVFEGPSNIVSDEKKSQNVKIVYSYDDKVEK